MNKTDWIEVLSQQPFLLGLPPKHLAKLAPLAKTANFATGETIFREGDRHRNLYLIRSGTVALETVSGGRVIRVQTLSRGDELGWSSILPKSRKYFQARALEPAEAIALDGVKLREMCDRDHEFGYLLLDRVVHVLARRLQAVRLQSVDAYGPGAHGLMRSGA